MAATMTLNAGTLPGRVAPHSAVRSARCSRPVRCRLARPTVARAVAQEQTPQQAGTKEAENQLEALKAISLVVADTGEIDSIRSYKPVDCTTNPSLVLKAVQNPQYHHYLEKAMAQEHDHHDSQNSDRYVKCHYADYTSSKVKNPKCFSYICHVCDMSPCTT